MTSLQYPTMKMSASASSTTSPISNVAQTSSIYETAPVQLRLPIHQFHVVVHSVISYISPLLNWCVLHHANCVISTSMMMTARRATTGRPPRTPTPPTTQTPALYENGNTMSPHPSSVHVNAATLLPQYPPPMSIVYIEAGLLRPTLLQRRCRTSLILAPQPVDETVSETTQFEGDSTTRPIGGSRFKDGGNERTTETTNDAQPPRYGCSGGSSTSSHTSPAAKPTTNPTAASTQHKSPRQSLAEFGYAADLRRTIGIHEQFNALWANSQPVLREVLCHESSAVLRISEFGR